jgi:opacity protein-like surface antigen
VGARVGNYYQTFGGQRINNFALTAGFGLPLKIWGVSTVNVGFEYGRISAKNAVVVNDHKVGLIKQNTFKFTLGFSLFSADTADYWFVKQKYD